MCDECISRTSRQPNPGYAQDVSSPTTAGMRNVPTEDVKAENLNQWYKDPIKNPPTLVGGAAGQGSSPRNGSPIFYALLEKMARIHDKKSHDYASNDNPFQNYHFAGQMSQLFKNADDAGFIGRIGEKLFRLANLENHNKTALNENIEDTEMDLCVIMALWVADRRTRRMRMTKSATPIQAPSGGQIFDPNYVNRGEHTSAEQARRYPMPPYNQD